MKKTGGSRRLPTGRVSSMGSSLMQTSGTRPSRKWLRAIVTIRTCVDSEISPNSDYLVEPSFHRGSALLEKYDSRRTVQRNPCWPVALK